MLSRFLPVSSDSAMNFAMNFLKRLVFMRPVCECSANVIPIFLKQKFKKGRFYCPFFLFIRKSLVMNIVMNDDECIFNKLVNISIFETSMRM